MAPDERTRIELTEWLVQQYGRDMAAYLMEVIPPFGWDEIAKKSDLTKLQASLSERIDLRIDSLGHQLRGEFQRQTNRLLMWVLPTVIAAIVGASALN